MSYGDCGNISEGKLVDVVIMNLVRDISKNYYLRPELPVHLTHGTLRTQTDVLDATSD